MTQHKFSSCICLWILLTVMASGTGAATPLDAENSDPKALGWMQGFPPPTEKLITQPDSNYFSFPKLRWSVCHLRELLPTKPISRGLGAPVPLKYSRKRTLEKASDEIDALTFTPIGASEEMSWQESLFANYTDGILVLHRGRVVYERYFGCLEEDGKHAAMSMTKSVTGLLAEIMIAEGDLDDTVTVDTIIPEIAGSAFASATVREVMDMITGLNTLKIMLIQTRTSGCIRVRQAHCQNLKTTADLTAIGNTSSKLNPKVSMAKHSIT